MKQEAELLVMPSRFLGGIVEFEYTDVNNNIAAKGNEGITIAHGRAMEMMDVKIGDSAKGTVLENIHLYNNMKCKDIENIIDGMSL